jgi:hypothetical protein
MKETDAFALLPPTTISAAEKTSGGIYFGTTNTAVRDWSNFTAEDKKYVANNKKKWRT